MSFGADCLINKLNGCIVGLGTDLATACDFAQVSGSLNSLENATLSVPNVNSLPAAADNEGRFIYVEDIKSFRYSDGYYWTKDACSVLGDVNTAGTLWSWGLNSSGTLGDGTTVNRCSPGTVAGGSTTWCDITGGISSLMTIKTDGTLWTWGCGCCGQLGDGTTVNRCSPGTIAGGGTTWCQVSSFGIAGAAIKTDGTLWTWGWNAQGRLGDGTTVCRCSPGTTWGSFNTWCKVSGGGSFFIAMKCDGTLWTWGSGLGGRLGDGTTVDRCSPGTVAGGGTTWCFIDTGGSQSSAIKTDGTLWTWGCNSCAALGDGTTVDRCSPGTTSGCGTNWCQASSASCHTMAIKTDGTLWTWGRNTYGVLGTGEATTVSRCSPGTVAGGGTTWCLSCNGYRHSAAIKTDGTLWTWGNNASGQLGDGTTVSRCSPGTVAGNSNSWCSLTVGCFLSAIRTRGF